MKTMTEYSHDPQVLYAYRDRLGDLTDRFGVPPRTRGETISAYAAFPEGIDVERMSTICPRGVTGPDIGAKASGRNYTGRRMASRHRT